MLTPTDIHFLVGLLTLISRSEGVELELGSMVFDAAAEEHRDVDITVRPVGDDGTISVFEGLEVKDHTRPLDVTHVEQLCAKLRDMPAITDRGIVSASGYTIGAVNKARYSGVSLYSLIEWTAPIEIATVTLIPNFDYVEADIVGSRGLISISAQTSNCRIPLSKSSDRRPRFSIRPERRWPRRVRTRR